VPVFSKWQTLQQFFLHPKAAEVLMSYFASMSNSVSEEETNLEVIFNMPLIKLASFGVATEEQINGLVEAVNQAVRSEGN
jgi:hypothetical protein